jgi:hypothetical protein
MPPQIMEVAMGGVGSGARRSTYVANVEDTLAIDIRVLRRLGVVRTGECVCDTVHWSIGGVSAPGARLRVDLSDIERGGTMIITGDVSGTISQHIAIDAVPSTLGGWRCYFICPVTDRRCEVLYYAQGQFASRAAQRLTYAVQSMDELSRARRRAAKLRRRLHGSDTLPRPRGRNRINLVEQLRKTEFEAKALYFERLGQMVDRSATRTVPATSR